MTALPMRLAVLCFAFVLSGCMNLAWIGYDSPTEYTAIEGGCFEIGLQNLDPVQRAAIVEAAEAVCEVQRSQAFRDAVESRSDWLASCKRPGGEPDRMDGEAVFAALSAPPPPFSVHPRNPWQAIAQTQRSSTSPEKNRVAIRPDRIGKWDRPETRGALVNTVAHEVTHLAPVVFSDDGHGSRACPDAALVSYGTGDLVERLWRERQAATE